MTVLYASFFTPAYTDEAMGLVESLDALDLSHFVQPMESRGDWITNCSRKAAYLLSTRRTFPNRRVVWLDADARVIARPVLFDTLDCDFACHHRHGEELLSGTLFFAPTHAATGLLRAWNVAGQMNPREWDQKVLQLCVASAKGLRVAELPSEYVRVFDDPKMGEPVILHRQASRTLRDLVQ